jgi:UDP-glucose 4-epimerase
MTTGQKPGRVLVTGGAGFIGSHIAEALITDGWETHLLDSLATGSVSNVPVDAHLHVADIRSESEIANVFRAGPFDAIVHCAAQTSVERSMHDPQLDREVNVTGTRLLLAAAKEAARFVFMSSGGAIYGETYDPATELSVPTPRSFYGMNKYVGEEFVRASGLPFAIMRPSNVYGPRQRADAEGGVLAIFCERLAAGQPIEVHGDGHQVRDFVYVADLVDAIRLALATDENVTWNVSSGTATTVLDAAEAIGTELGVHPDLRFGPRRAGDIDKSLLSNALLLSTKQWGPPLSLAAGLQRLTAEDVRV